MVKKSSLLEQSVEYNLEPLEGVYEKVNKMKYVEDRNEGDRNFIQLYLILNYQTHFDTGKVSSQMCLSHFM